MDAVRHREATTRLARTLDRGSFSQSRACERAMSLAPELAYRRPRCDVEAGSRPCGSRSRRRVRPPTTRRRAPLRNTVDRRALERNAQTQAGEAHAEKVRDVTTFRGRAIRCIRARGRSHCAGPFRFVLRGLRALPRRLCVGRIFGIRGGIIVCPGIGLARPGFRRRPRPTSTPHPRERGALRPRTRLPWQTEAVVRSLGLRPPLLRLRSRGQRRRQALSLRRGFALSRTPARKRRVRRSRGSRRIERAGKNLPSLVDFWRRLHLNV